MALAGNYEDGGRANLAIFQPASRILIIVSNDSGSAPAFEVGAAGDIPLTGDYDGDGRDDLVTFHPATASAPATFTIVNLFTRVRTVRPWGGVGDVLLKVPNR